MRIVIDLQGAQNNSCNRGIGRYSLSIAQALSRQRGEHNIILVLNGAFADTIDRIILAFEGLLDVDNIKIWYPLTPVWSQDQDNSWRRKASEILYEKFVESLEPDVLLICTQFEGWTDNTVTSIHQLSQNYLVAVILYDMIPLIEISENKSDWDRNTLNWYFQRLDHLRRANLLLAISESSRKEAIEHIPFPAENVVNISAAADNLFQPMNLTDENSQQLLTRYGISKPFVMSAAVVEPRKNLQGLIQAYALLPENIRNKYQLVLVGSLNIAYVEKLLNGCARYGLTPVDMIFTGYVPDRDLVALYNLCNIFVFPSFHEGFGLPALEAMACGAPTLASNRSSLPEVVGHEAALFDPYDPRDMARVIERGLTDETFRQQIKMHGLEQKCKFSWDASARCALHAMETLLRTKNDAMKAVVSPTLPFSGQTYRPRLAFVSPLQRAQCGIADYSAELLPELARHYAIEVIVDQAGPVMDPWVLANATQRSVAWFEHHALEYDRILYQFGNSHFHQHMFGLLKRYPGVVVLHDFFLSGVISVVLEEAERGIWARMLLHAHGWNALVERYKEGGKIEVEHKYPCNLDVLEMAVDIIVHSPYSKKLAAHWYGLDYGKGWAQIPLLRVPVSDVMNRRAVARADLGLDEDSFLICSFGNLSKTKLNHRLIDAWRKSRLVREKHCRIVFVGQMPGTDYADELMQLLHEPDLKGLVHVTGWADDDTYRRYLAAADLAVQLRTLSRGETSAAVLDCMNYGVATIVNANGSLADLPSDCVHMLSDNFETEELVGAIETLWRNVSMRHAIGMRAAQYIRNHHNPRQCADQYAQFIEESYLRAEHGPSGLIKSVQRLVGPPQNLQDLGTLAEKIAQIFPAHQPARQLFVDISELVHRDGKTGIERVGKNLLHQLLEQPPIGFRVEPVYATREHGYRYARHFTARFLRIPPDGLQDDPVETYAGDVFFGMDWQPVVVPDHHDWLQEIRQRGVSVYFLLHDILPLTFPEGTTREVAAHHFRWLQTVAQADGVVCVSKTVADALVRWLDLFGPDRVFPLQIGWSHSGANFVREKQDTASATGQHAALLHQLARAPSFLMVGTVEPRKGHAQVLAAFDLLWRQGMQVNLVIVGKQGWMIEELANQLNSHPERERRLFWMQGIDDDLLEQIYTSSTCLIAGSLAEGFGLPLIEAAQHKLPILARDIPVFREVAGEHASYFTGDAPLHLVKAVKCWLQAHQVGCVPQTDGMPWLTWQQSTQNLLAVMLGGDWYRQWLPQADTQLVARYWGSDPRLGSVVGEMSGITCQSKGVAGNLLHGPYISLKPGAYMAVVQGTSDFGIGQGTTVDVAVKGGTVKLAEATLAWDEIEVKKVLAILSFVLEEPCTDMEVRVHVAEESDVRISMLEIRTQYGTAQTLTPQISSGPKLLHTGVGGRNSSFSSAVAHSYWATHPRLHTQVGQKVGRTLWTHGKAGFLLHGPYIGLPAGNYCVTVYGQINCPEGSHDAWMDVVAQKGSMQLVKGALEADARRAGQLTEITFTLNSYTEDVEVRVWVGAVSDLEIKGIQIAQIPETEEVAAPAQGLPASITGQDASPPKVYYFWASHARLKTQVARKIGRALATQGKAGCLLHGPYIGLSIGTYRAVVFGNVTGPGGIGGAWMDVAVPKDGRKGGLSLGNASLAADAGQPGQLGEITFTLNNYREDVEIRIWVGAASELLVTGIQIEQIRVENTAKGTPAIPATVKATEMWSKANIDAMKNKQISAKEGAVGFTQQAVPVETATSMTVRVADGACEDSAAVDATNVQICESYVEHLNVIDVLENTEKQADNNSVLSMTLTTHALKCPSMENNEPTRTEHYQNGAAMVHKIRDQVLVSKDSGNTGDALPVPHRAAGIERKNKSADDTAGNKASGAMNSRYPPSMEDKSGKELSIGAVKKPHTANRLKNKKTTR